MEKQNKQRLNNYLNELWGDIEDIIMTFDYEMELYLEEDDVYAEEAEIRKIFKCISLPLSNVQKTLENHFMDNKYIDLKNVDEFELIFNSIISYLDAKIDKLKEDDLLDFEIKGIDYLILSKYAIKSFLSRCKVLKREISL